jgi:hypothetical protein
VTEAGPVGRRGAYPGSFNPATVAHLAVAEAARRQCRLDVVHLVLSTTTLGKHDHPDLAPVTERAEALARLTDARPWLQVVVAEQSLLVDLAEGYDVLVLGADKWAQVQDPAWYDGPVGRDAALARLPHLALAPRPPHPLPPSDGPGITVLDLHPDHHAVSATAVRAGRHDWLAPDLRPPPA